MPQINTILTTTEKYALYKSRLDLYKKALKEANEHGLTEAAETFQRRINEYTQWIERIERGA